MFVKIFLSALVVAAVMAAIKDGRILRATGLTGSCSVVRTGPTGWRLDVCKPGRLKGAPSLAGAGCTPAGAYPNAVYWRCPPG
jgi:hypothetical protein